MKKSKAITLLSLICVLLVALIVATFARFQVGINDYNSFLGAIKLDFDLDGGISYTYELDNNDADVDEVIDLMSDRLERLGYDYYSIEAVKDSDPDVKDSDIVISLKNTATVNEDIAAVTAYGSVKMYAGADSSSTELVLEGKSAVEYCNYLGKATALEGSAGYKMELKFTNEACDIIEDGKNYVKLVLGDDENNVLFENSISADELQSGKYSFGYTNQASEDMAKRIALQISTGGLDYKYKQIKAEIISPVFGKNAKTYLIVIISILLVAVIVAFSILFKGFGVISGISLLTYILCEIVLLVTIPNVVLSTSGVVGVILAGALVTDGLIITIKRMQEEFESGKTVKAAVNMGYRRSFRPILNTHVVAILIALLSFLIVGSTVKSFAITLSIGVALSFVITAFVSKLLTIILIPIVKNPEGFFNFKRKGE